MRILGNGLFKVNNEDIRSSIGQAMLWKYSEDYAKFNTTISSIVILVGSMLLSVSLILT